MLTEDEVKALASKQDTDQRYEKPIEALYRRKFPNNNGSSSGSFAHVDKEIVYISLLLAVKPADSGLVN